MLKAHQSKIPNDLVPCNQWPINPLGNADSFFFSLFVLQLSPGASLF